MLVLGQATKLEPNDAFGSVGDTLLGSRNQEDEDREGASWLQPKASPKRCLLNPCSHMCARLDSHQQRPRLRDLRHFGRRHETFEGRREDGVDVRPPATPVDW